MNVFGVQQGNTYYAQQSSVEVVVLLVWLLAHQVYSDDYAGDVVRLKIHCVKTNTKKKKKKKKLLETCSLSSSSLGPILPILRYYIIISIYSYHTHITKNIL